VLLVTLLVTLLLLVMFPPELKLRLKVSLTMCCLLFRLLTQRISIPTDRPRWTSKRLVMRHERMCLGNQGRWLE